jgi:hypothetical protein
MFKAVCVYCSDLGFWENIDGGAAAEPQPGTIEHDRQRMKKQDSDVNMAGRRWLTFCLQRLLAATD